ncbi:glycosyl hydrolase [bacterium]|nr:glycosyl hydrolase [bacterium]
MKTLLAILMLVLVLPVGPANAADDAEETSPLNSGALAGLAWRGIGPAFMSGRIADVVLVPDDPGTWYVGVGSGGVWKTTNAGTTWQPIFDGQGSYSIGCVTLDPRQPATVWVGTGENVSGRHVGYGDGVYRSRDAGRTWENLGLAQSEHIGRIVVHPEFSDVVYVAAQGPLWSAGGDRGLFMTTDGGESWEKVLGDDAYTGVNEVVMDPFDSDVLYASTWQRFRDVAVLMDGGPGSGIHKSTDGGRTWRRVKTGLPTEAMGRIGLAASPQQPGVIYAAIELGARKGGFWRSADGGESWTKMSDHAANGTGPHYYNEIFASPHEFDTVYFMNVEMDVTTDGGRTFRKVGEKDKHVDNHALAFSATDPDYLLAGCDGGLYESWDRGANWKFVGNLPVTQFYKIDVDYDTPFYHVVGGTQDNNTQYGPSRTDNLHGIRNADWSVTLFGDGHQPAIDPGNPDIIYSCWQQTNSWRIDRKTGEGWPIRPMQGPGGLEERWNWDGPLQISHHDPARLYTASQRLWRSDDRGDSWTAISPDLTRAEDRLLRPVMGRVHSVDDPIDLLAMSMYGTLTNIAESPVDADVLYVGSDDGRLHASEDGGATWRECRRPKGLPEHFYVNDLAADRFDRDTVYLLVDQHKQGDFAPYLFKSTDAGRSWRSIAGDLPERHIVWRLAQDTVRPDLLFVGTEFGVFYTPDGGGRWLKLGAGMPTIPVRDLKIQTRENDLVAGTFGRGIYVLDDYTPLRDIDAEALTAEARLFAPREAKWYMPRRVIGTTLRASQGSAHFSAPNPPFGAVFTYFLRDSLQTLASSRRTLEKELAAEGEDTPYPGWDALRAEELEDPPTLTLVVRNTDGWIVQRVPATGAAGVQRVAWDLSHASLRPETDGKRDPAGGPMLAAPGAYTVELVRRRDGLAEILAGPVAFRVTPLRDDDRGGLAPAALEAWVLEVDAFDDRLSDLTSVIGEMARHVDKVKAALERAVVDDPPLYATTIDLEKRLEQLRERLGGNRRRGRYNDAEPLSVARRMDMVRTGAMMNTVGPTTTHREQFGYARAQADAVASDLARITEVEWPTLVAALDAAGVPWTPGRAPRGE